MDKTLTIRRLGLQDYEPVWHAMQTLTQQRDANSPDEMWLLQHPPVFTLGLNGKREHLLHETDIPIIDIDRGGQVTYHGPGQLVAYTLIDIARNTISIRDLVDRLEQCLIDLLADYGIAATRRDKAPGVYVDDAKIAALGLRIRRGCSYHGLALNIDMDLTPFGVINPCGYANMPVTQLKDLLTTPLPSMSDVEQRLTQHMMQQFGYTHSLFDDTLPATIENAAHV